MKTKQLMIIIPSIAVAVAIAVTSFVMLSPSSAEADSGRSVSEAKGMDPYEDPYSFLRAALKATGEDVVLRYNGSPATALRESMSADELSVSVSVSTDNEALDGDVYIDSGSERLWFDGILSSQGADTPFGFYCDEDFVGISCPYIFGSGTLYGMRPEDTRETEESVIGNMLPEDSKRLIDGANRVIELITIPDFREELAEDFAELFETFNSSADFEVDERSVAISETEYDGYIFTGVYKANKIADLVTGAADILAENEDVRTFIDLYAELCGTELTADDVTEELKSVADELRESGAKITVTYYVADYRVSAVDISAKAADCAADSEIDFYYSDESGVSIDVESSVGSDEPVSVRYTTKTDVSDGYSERTSLTFTESDDDSYNITGRISWDGDGALKISSGNSDGESVTVEGRLTTEKDGGFELTDAAVDFDDGYNSDTLNITMTGANDSPMPETPEKVNVFQMTQAELFEFIRRVTGLMESDAA